MTHIYIHGLGQTPAAWEKTVQGLAPKEAAACPDLPQLLAGQAVNYANLYAVFARYCDGFGGDLALCGLSLGGVLALHYAIDHPEKVRALVLIAAQYQMPKRLLGFQNAVFRLMPASMFRETGLDKADFLTLCKTMAALDFSDSIQIIACPTLVVCGEKDSANRKAAEGLARALPHAELRIVNGAGHEVNVDAPETLTALLREFYQA